MNYTKDFEEFWRKYPFRWNKDLGQWVKRRKYPAFQKWSRLSAEIKMECLSKVHLIKKSEGGAVRDCVTWLNQQGWDDFKADKTCELPAKFKELVDGVFNKSTE